jgi:hypothetical protein
MIRAFWSESGSGSKPTTLMTQSWFIFTDDWKYQILISSEKNCRIFLRLASRKDFPKLPSSRERTFFPPCCPWRVKSFRQSWKIMKQVTNNLFFDPLISSNWYGKELQRYCWQFSNDIYFGLNFCMRRRSFGCLLLCCGPESRFEILVPNSCPNLTVLTRMVQFVFDNMQ